MWATLVKVLMNMVDGGESTLDLCYASSEEIPELQRPRCATENRRNLQCGDDSILRANVTRDKGSPCLGAGGGLVLGIGLAGCRFLCAGKYIALLIEQEWSGPQHPAHGGNISRDPVHDLASARGHEWLATCVPV